MFGVGFNSGIDAWVHDRVICLMDSLLAAYLLGSVVFADEYFMVSELMFFKILICETFVKSVRRFLS